MYPSDLKRTKQRENILSVLKKAKKPLSATDICAEIEKEGGSAWLSTVYRTLELFEKKGIIVKISVMNNEMALYELNKFQHKHYAVCMGCNTIFPIPECPIRKSIPKIQDGDFKVVGHNLELYGYCRSCSSGE